MGAQHSSGLNASHDMGYEWNSKENKSSTNICSTASSSQDVSSPARSYLDGLAAGNLTQNRYSFIKSDHLNKETVAGIVDNTMGRVSKLDGKPVGTKIIRFDTGLNTDTKPHINIDPDGIPSHKNAHIEVSPSVIQGAKHVGTGLKAVSKALPYAAIASDAERLTRAFQKDLQIRENSNEKAAFSETIKEAASVTGGWVSGAVTGSVCAAVARPASAIACAPLGPVAPVCTVAVSTAATYGCAMIGGEIGSEVAKDAAEMALEKLN